MDFNSLSDEDKPREKLKQRGVSSLTDSELLALILRTGSKGEDVLKVSRELMSKFNLKRLSRLPLKVLQNTHGIGEVKAGQIIACFELGRRLNKFKERTTEVKSARDVARLFSDEMRTLSKEHLRIVLLNTKRKIIHVEDLFIGSLNESVIHPREIFEAALNEHAAAIILVHNHPSGDPTPSSADISVTQQLVSAGALLGIPVLDHIIIGDKRYTSMREEHLIRED